MWREGRNAGSRLCTQTRIRTGRTEVRSPAPLVTVLAASPRWQRSGALRESADRRPLRHFMQGFGHFSDLGHPFKVRVIKC